MDEYPVGRIIIVAHNNPIMGCLECNGQYVSKASYKSLFEIIGNSFGETNTSFALPDLNGRAPVQADSKRPLGTVEGSETVQLQGEHLPPHTHQVRVLDVAADQADPSDHNLASGSARGTKFYAPVSDKRVLNSEMIGSTGMAQEHINMQPYQSLRYLISTDSYGTSSYLASISMFAFDFTPRFYLPCDGATLVAAQNAPLYSLIGDHFGGNGSNFKLPELRGRVPIGSDKEGSAYPLGSNGGLEMVNLVPENLPPHSHGLSMAIEGGTLIGGGGNILAGLAPIQSNVVANSALRYPTVSQTKTETHENMMPFIAINFCLKYQGPYPTPPPQQNGGAI